MQAQCETQTKEEEKKMEKKVPSRRADAVPGGGLREGRRIGLTAGIEAKFGDPSERTHDAASAVTRWYVQPLGGVLMSDDRQCSGESGWDVRNPGFWVAVSISLLLLLLLHRSAVQC
jgi:hypothetical protein